MKMMSKTEKRIQRLEATIDVDQFWETYPMAFKRCMVAKHQKSTVKLDDVRNMLGYPQHHENEYHRSTEGFNTPYRTLTVDRKNRIKGIIPSGDIPKNARVQKRRLQQIAKILSKALERNHFRMEFSEGRHTIPGQFLLAVSKSLSA